MKKKLGELLLQIIPVMIGVYLGFVISNWSENKKIKSQVSLFKINLKAEIENNKNRIQDVIEYHKVVRDSSQYYRQVKLTKMPRFFAGVRTSALSNSAFESGIQTGLINGLPFKDIQSLNYVYTIQDSYNDFSTLLLAGLINSDFPEDENGLKKLYKYLSISMTDVVIKEKELIEKYDDLLKQLNTE